MICMKISIHGNSLIPFLIYSINRFLIFSITFQAASNRGNASNYRKGLRESIDSNINNYQRIHIFENIKKPENKFEVFRSTPENNRLHKAVPGYRGSELIAKSKFSKGLNTSIKCERNKRKDGIKSHLNRTNIHQDNDEESKEINIS